MKSLIYGYGVTGKSFERYLTKRNIPFDIFDENIDEHNKKNNLCDYQTIFCSPGIPKDLYESAKIDGAGDFKSFWYITLPLLAPAIIVALLLRTMDALRVFELPFNLTDGGPLNTTETISLYSYRVLFEFVEFNYGSSMVIIQFILIMIMSLIYIKSIKNIDY